ncbi:MAG: hypothetical protein MHM6MM_001626 [Cercozoa sp. M6MM]
MRIFVALLGALSLASACRGSTCRSSSAPPCSPCAASELEESNEAELLLKEEPHPQHYFDVPPAPYDVQSLGSQTPFPASYEWSVPEAPYFAPGLPSWYAPAPPAAFQSSFDAYSTDLAVSSVADSDTASVSSFASMHTQHTDTQLTDSRADLSESALAVYLSRHMLSAKGLSHLAQAVATVKATRNHGSHAVQHLNSMIQNAFKDWQRSVAQMIDQQTLRQQNSALAGTVAVVLDPLQTRLSGAFGDKSAVYVNLVVQHERFSRSEVMNALSQLMAFLPRTPAPHTSQEKPLISRDRGGNVQLRLVTPSPWGRDFFFFIKAPTESFVCSAPKSDRFSLFVRTSSVMSSTLLEAKLLLDPVLIESVALQSFASSETLQTMIQSTRGRFDLRARFLSVVEWTLRYFEQHWEHVVTARAPLQIPAIKLDMHYPVDLIVEEKESSRLSRLPLSAQLHHILVGTARVRVMTAQSVHWRSMLDIARSLDTSDIIQFDAHGVFLRLALRQDVLFDSSSVVSHLLLRLPVAADH